MRRVSRSALAVGVAAVLLGAGAAYALGSSMAKGQITVCVRHDGGELYKATKCQKHDKTLSWNATGPRGLRGLTGATGTTGAIGPQGQAGATGPSAGTIVTYDAAASSPPAPSKVIGTFLGDTLTASCEGDGDQIHMNVNLTTSTGAWSADFASMSQTTGSAATPNLSSYHFPPGTLPPGFGVLSVSAYSGQTSESREEWVQVAPSPGFMILHGEVTTPGWRCHLSVQTLPETIAAVPTG